VNLGPTELIIVLLIVMLLFGAARLPKLARSLGESARELRKGMADADRNDEPDDKKT
jgi:sec-independent protein translocase protein TatA